MGPLSPEGPSWGLDDPSGGLDDPSWGLEDPGLPGWWGEDGLTWP